MRVCRFLCPGVLEDRDARCFRVSFRVAEEGTWDHKFHDLAGGVVRRDELRLSEQDLLDIQTICDEAVGRPLEALIAIRDSGWTGEPPARASTNERERRCIVFAAPVARRRKAWA